MTKKIRTCITCQTEFTCKYWQLDHVYCSTKCCPIGKNRDGTDRKKKKPHSKTSINKWKSKNKSYWKRWKAINPRPSDEPGEFTDDWFAVSEKIRERDDWSCLICPKIGDKFNIGEVRALPVHHVNEDRQDNRPKNLATLCESCHINKPHYIPPRGKLSHIRWIGLWLKNKLRWVGYFEAVMNDEAMRKKNAEMP